MDVNGVLDHRAVLKHLDLLGHTSNGEVVTVAVKLDAAPAAEGTRRVEQGRRLGSVKHACLKSEGSPGNDAGAIVEVAGV